MCWTRTSLFFLNASSFSLFLSLELASPCSPQGLEADSFAQGLAGRKLPNRDDRQHQVQKCSRSYSSAVSLSDRPVSIRSFARSKMICFAIR